MDDVALTRLEDQIAWYDQKAVRCQARYKQLKIGGLVAAAAIPVVAAFNTVSAVAAVLGGLVVLLEGVQQLNQYQANWIAYRSTCEALKHEKYLFLAHAAHYALASSASVLLAERVESLVSQEHAKWATSQQSGKPKVDGHPERSVDDAAR